MRFLSTDEIVACVASLLCNFCRPTKSLRGWHHFYAILVGRVQSDNIKTIWQRPIKIGRQKSHRVRLALKEKIISLCQIQTIILQNSGKSTKNCQICYFHIATHTSTSRFKISSVECTCILCVNMTSFCVITSHHISRFHYHSPEYYSGQWWQLGWFIDYQSNKDMDWHGNASRISCVADATSMIWPDALYF